MEKAREKCKALRRKGQDVKGAGGKAQEARGQETLHRKGVGDEAAGSSQGMWTREMPTGTLVEFCCAAGNRALFLPNLLKRVCLYTV